LELEAECLRDELQSLKADARLKSRDLDAAHHIVRALEQKALLGEQAARIGKVIRMRYLEEHRTLCEEFVNLTCRFLSIVRHKNLE
jgi:hypothetical protein